MKMYLFNLCISFLLIIFSADNAFSRDKKSPPDTTTNLLNKAAALVIIEEAKEIFNQGKVRDALIKFREAAIKDPNSWRAIYWVSQCQYSMNNFGLALKYALDAVSLKQEDIDNELYELLARSYHRMGEIDSALVNYNIALTKLSQMRSKELQIELRIEQCMFAKAEMAGPDKSKKTQISSLNSGFNDYCPIIVDGGKGIYFTSRRSNTSGGRMNPDDQEYFEDTYYAIWNSENND
jgi:tetratricopeptide (TPR) repeat protein